MAKFFRRVIAAAVLALLVLAGTAASAFAVSTPSASASASASVSPLVAQCASNLTSYAKANGLAAVVAVYKTLPPCNQLTPAQMTQAVEQAYKMFGMASQAASAGMTGTASPTATPTGMASGTATATPTMAPATGGGKGSDVGLVVMTSVGLAAVAGGGVLLVRRARSRG